MPWARRPSICSSEKSAALKSLGPFGWMVSQEKIRRVHLMPAAADASGSPTAWTAPNQGSELDTGGRDAGASETGIGAAGTGVWACTGSWLAASISITKQTIARAANGRRIATPMERNRDPSDEPLL